MDRLQGAVQPGGSSQLVQSEVVLFLEKRSEVAAMGGENNRFAPGQMMTRSDVPGSPPLLQELLDHAQRNAETAGDLLTSTFFTVVGREDSFPQIQRKRSHALDRARLD